jgi:phosphate transport system substrate-binding protein
MTTQTPLLRRSLAAALAVSTTGALLAGCGGGGSATLSGAGASFPAAIYQRWFQDLASKGVQVNYQSVGSGAGVRQFLARTVDFGASDVPMKEDEKSQVKQGVVQIPMTAGAIAVAYNNPGCELRLSQGQLAAIFLGKIRNFSEVGCAAKPIKVVHRSDGSGTTANFTAHLAAISPAWKAGPGAGKTVTWPTGIGAKGNEGVAAQLGQLDGGIGYVEIAYVKGDLQAASLTNGSGEMVKPTNESETTALASIDLGPDLTGSNPNPRQGYPIVTFSWILLYKTGNGDRLEGLRKVFGYTLSDPAQAKAPELGYVSLPPSVVAKAREKLATLEK